MKRILFSFLAILALSISSNMFSQGKAFIKFDKTVHDYGKIKESDGPAKCVYNFAFFSVIFD